MFRRSPAWPASSSAASTSRSTRSSRRSSRRRRQGSKALIGKVAIANAKVAYASFQKIFSGPAWEALATKGAQKQRLLWASTGTKNKAYKDTIYVEELIGPDTVNTIPPATFDAFRDHGLSASSLRRIEGPWPQRPRRTGVASRRSPTTCYRRVKSSGKK